MFGYFRVWDEEKRRYVKKIKKRAVKFVRSGNVFKIKTKYTIDYSTGYEDSKGNKIFFGDIIQINKYNQRRLYIVESVEGEVAIRDSYTTETYKHEKARVIVVGNIRTDVDLINLIEQK